MVERLDIKIDTGDAAKRLKALASSVNMLTKALSTIPDASAKINSISQALNSLRPINSNVAQSVKSLDSAIKNVSGTGNITKVSADLTKMGAVQMGGTVTAINNIASAAAKLGSNSGLGAFPAQANKVETALKTTAIQAKVSAAALRALGGAANTTGTSASTMGSKFNDAVGRVRNLKTAMASLSSSMSTARGKIAGASQALNEFRGRIEVQAVLSLGKAIYQAGNNFQSFEIASTAVAKVGEDVVALRKDVEAMASRTATDVTSMIDNFKNFSIASQTAGFSVQKTKDIFESFSTALRVTGASTDAQNRTFLALTQMMSKGVVSMEELRRQMGESLPGAFQIAAEAMGMTTAELDKAVSSGKVLSEDLIPKLAAALSNKFGSSLAAAMETPAAKMVSLSNKVQHLFDIISRGQDGASGMFSGLVTALDSLTNLASSAGITNMAEMLGEIAAVSMDVLAIGIDAISIALNAVSPVLVTVKAGFSAVAAIMNGLSTALESTTGFILSLGGYLGTASEYGISFRDIITAMVSGLIAMRAAFTVTVIATWGAGLITAATGASTAMGGLRIMMATVTTSIKGMTLASTLLKGALIASGIGIIMIAIGEAISLYTQWSEETSRVAEATKVQTKTLANLTPELKKTGEDLRKLAQDTGLNNTETMEFVRLGLLAAATSSELVDALDQEITKLEERKEIQLKSVEVAQKNIEKLKALAEAQGGTTAAITKAINSQVKAIETSRQAATATEDMITRKRNEVEAINLLSEATDGATEATNKSAEATKTAASAIATNGPTLSKFWEATKTVVAEYVLGLEGVTEKSGGAAEGTDKVATSMEKVSTVDTSGVDTLTGRLSGLETQADSTATALERAATASASLGGGGGGGGGSAESFRQGGMSGSSIERAKVSPSTFSGALPHLADGITNTNKLSKRADGGMPAMLHPNEAVVPLSKGRSIPVAIKMPAQRPHPPAPEKKQTQNQVDKNSEDAKLNSRPTQRDIKVEINIQAMDVSSFKQSENQMLREFAVKLGEAIQQHG